MKISFVIPAFNNAEWLHPAVDSCLKQTYKKVEVVIVDDGSTDSTGDYLVWLAAQGDRRVKIIRLEKNMGRSHARNVGAESATGDIIAVLDADDISMPKRAELTVARFEAGARFVHGAAHRMDPVGRDLGMMPTDVFSKEKAMENLTNGIVHSTVAMTRELALGFKYSEGEPARLGVDDWEQQVRLCLAGVKFDYIPAPLTIYRDGVGITANRNEDEVRQFKKGYLSVLEMPA